MPEPTGSYADAAPDSLRVDKTEKDLREVKVIKLCFDAQISCLRVRAVAVDVRAVL